MSVAKYIPDNVRTELEQRYYAQVNEQAKLENLQSDAAFMAKPDNHVGLFADHGIVHVRDVAQQILIVLDRAHGVIIPRRSAQRFERMRGCGVLMAYFHDIGMKDFSAFGRAMHPEYAAQALFQPDIESLLQEILAWDSGGLTTHLLELESAGVLPQPAMTVLRELLALTACHSKSKVPVSILQDPKLLRERMLHIVQDDLKLAYMKKYRPKEKYTPISTSQPPYLAKLYANFMRDGFSWLVSESQPLQQLTADVIDTVRALRCADALRQRGTVLETSGGYEVFVDQRTAHAIYAMRQGKDRLLLLELVNPISVGEANLSSSELDPDCNLRLSCQRGAFATPEATNYSASCVALVIEDIQRDVISSFFRGDNESTVPKPANQIEILLEETDDNPAFVEMVITALKSINPVAASQVCIVPSLQNVSPHEYQLYLKADTLSWDKAAKQELLAKVGDSGHPVANIDIRQAFDHVRLLTLAPDEVLLKADAYAGFVYIPLGAGLKVTPLGGYDPFYVQPWMPLGATGVIRGAPRNADIQAEKTVSLLMIPKMVYLEHWHNVHTASSFRKALNH